MFAPSQDHCILAGCDEQKHCRGLCKNDYIGASRLIKSGKTSWEEMESLGLSQAPKRTPIARSRVSILLEEARAAKADQERKA